LAAFQVSPEDLKRALGATANWSSPDVRMAIHGSRLVISDYSRKFNLIDGVWALGSLRKRVVWDFRSKKDLVRWKPGTQQALSYASTTQPYRYDISPDGQYIIEGGAGTLSLYRIEP